MRLADAIATADSTAMQAITTRRCARIKPTKRALAGPVKVGQS
jgi:hypothetical protein